MVVTSILGIMVALYPQEIRNNMKHILSNRFTTDTFLFSSACFLYMLAFTTYIYSRGKRLLIEKISEIKKTYMTDYATLNDAFTKDRVNLYDRFEKQDSEIRTELRDKNKNILSLYDDSKNIISRVENDINHLSENLKYFSNTTGITTRLLVTMINSVSNEAELVNSATLILNSGIPFDELIKIGISDTILDLVKAKYHTEKAQALAGNLRENINENNDIK